MILLKNGAVYSPEYLGPMDLLIGGGKILALAQGLEAPLPDTDVVDLSGLMVAPGMIDGHVHLSGAGGEGGPATRTPEVQLSHLTMAGVTSVVGCLGADGVTRTPAELLMKAKGLRQEGMSAWMYTGSYQIPTPTLTGDVCKDLCYVEEIVGAGEVAVADHRSSEPTALDLIRLAKKCRLGGMLGGKSGILHVHMGDGRHPFALIEEAVASSELTHKQFYPTHINRNYHIFEEAKEYAKKGYVDITTGSWPHYRDVEVKPSTAVRELMDAGAPLAHITMSSDAGGSLPEFNEQGELVQVEVGQALTLLWELRDMVKEEGLSLADALKTVTANPADILKLKNKGLLAPQMDADLFVIDEAFEIRHVMALGNWMVRDGVTCKLGTFEK